MDETTLVPAERRHINLTRGEREDLVDQRQIEEAVSYFLDLEQDRTVKQIADEMGISVSALKRLTQRPEFQAVYDETLMNLGHHPRLQSMNAQLPELLPLAYQALRSVLTGQRVAATAKVQAVKLLFDTLHISETRNDEDPAPLHNFMQQNGVTMQANVINVNLPIPEEYREAFSRLVGRDTNIIDADAGTPDSSQASRGAASDTSLLTEGSQTAAPAPEGE
jgi:hypothetical protein